MYFKNRADINRKYNRTISDVTDQIKTVNKAVSLKHKFLQFNKDRKLKQLSAFYQKCLIINKRFYVS